jgi:hypothetical protein
MGSAQQAGGSPSLLLGTDSRGNWIVRDRAGRRGGVFVNRSAALLYARLETGQRRSGFVTVTGNLELGVLTGR